MTKRDQSLVVAVARLLLTGSSAATLAMMAQPAIAQTAQATPQDTAQPAQQGMGDIVVTARYVAENIQNTPIAITAQTSSQLTAANVTNISSLGKVTPNLYTMPGDSQGAGTPVIGLRGVLQGTNASSSLAVPPAVAIYTDDIYHATTAGSELDLIDIDHVEVSRGPQSTLSGNASIAGSIKLYTVDPRGDDSGYIQVQGGSFERAAVKGAIDLGLTSTLALRTSASYERQTGFGNRLDFTCMMNKLGTPALAGSYPAIPGSSDHDCIIGHTGGGQTGVIQGKLRWRPTSDIDIILEGRHRRQDLDETPEVALAYNPVCVGQPTCTASVGVQAFQRASLNTYGIVNDSRFVTPMRNGGIYDTYATACRPTLNISGLPFSNPYPTNFCFAPKIEAHNTLASGKLHWKLGKDINFTAIAGYTNYANEFTQAGDASVLGAVLTHFYNFDHQWTGEARFDGKLFDDRLQWVVGGFLLRLTGHQNNVVSGNNAYFNSKVRGTNNSQSGFVHLDYNITDRWRISGGGRYTDGSIGITINNPQGVSVLTPVYSIEHRWDWLVASDYKITDTILGYVSAASGSRPPGLTTIVNTARQLSPVAAEDLISYEAGIKADLLDRHLRVDVDGFIMDYRQLNTAVNGVECINQPGATATWFNALQNTPGAIAACSAFPGTPNPILFTINVGKPATIKGFEWDITALPVDHLRLDWSGGFNHFKSGVTTPGQPGYFAPGNHRQPNWNMHADVSYDIPAGSHGTFTPRIDWSWQSQADYNPAPQSGPPTDFYIIHPYGIWNAQLAYKSPEDKWSAIFEVTNLANKWYHYQVYTGSVDSYTRVAPPREFRVSLRRQF